MRTAAWLRPSASNVTPVSRTSRRSASFWLSRIVSRLPLSRRSGPAFPTTSLRSWSRPFSDSATPVTNVLKSRRVAGVNARITSSSSVVGWTRASASRPPSGIFGALREPGDSSTYVSPSSVFVRRIACALLASGAYFESSCSVASVRWPCCASPTTLPTGTPEIRTSA